MKYELRIADRQGRDIEVFQQLPSKGDKFPTVIMVPGFGADLHEFGLFDDLASTFVKNSIQAVRFNFAGLGRSTGDYQLTTLDSQLSQLYDVISYVKKDRFTDHDSIGILGHGFGANVVLSAQPIEGIRALLLSDIILDPNDNLSRWFKRERGYNPEGISKRDRSNNTYTAVGSGFWKSINQMNLLTKARGVIAPTLLVHSSFNTVSKSWESREIFEALTVKKKLLVIKGAHQGYTKAARPVILKLTSDWFVEELILSSFIH